MALSEEQKEGNKQILLRAEKLKGFSNEIITSTIQFFFLSAKPKNHTAGSGVLFEINNEYFIFSAAHVFTENRNEIYVVSNEEPISLGGTLYTTRLPMSGLRNDDKIDSVIIHISPAIAEKIKVDYNFIKLSDIELGHYVDINTNYILAGYPITKTKEIWGVKGVLRSEPFVANLDTLIQFDYKLFNFSIGKHIAIAYKNNVISKNNLIPHLGPNLEGISGSGVWHFQQSSELKFMKPKLIGIVTEQIKEVGNKAIVATRIDHLIAFLNNQFDLHIFIPIQCDKYE